MNFKVTKKDVKRNFSRIIKLSYGDAQYLVCADCQVAHTEGTDGWDANVYKLTDSTAVVRGYHGFGDIVPDREVVEEYDKLAQAYHEMLSYNDRVESLQKLRVSFADKVISDYIKKENAEREAYIARLEAKEAKRRKPVTDAEEGLADAIHVYRLLIDHTFSEWFFGQTDDSYISGIVENASTDLEDENNVSDALERLTEEAYMWMRDDEHDPENLDEWSETSEAADIWDAIKEIRKKKIRLEKAWEKYDR